MRDSSSFGQFIDGNVGEDVPPLIFLSWPEVAVKVDNRLTSDEWSDWFDSHHVALPDSVFCKTVSKKISVAFVVSPPVAINPFGNQQSVERFVRSRNASEPLKEYSSRQFCPRRRGVSL